VRAWLALLALSCAPPCALASARDRWYAATGLREPASTSWEFAQAYTVPCGGATASGRGRFVGCTREFSDGSREVVVAELDDRCDVTTLHELGHVLGAEHTSAGVMTSNRHASGHRSCITSWDVWAVCSERTCLWERPECD
jgi:hypothetical protein